MIDAGKSLLGDLGSLGSLSRVASGPTENDAWLRFQWLDRQVRAVELLVSQEKTMAGLPNFATYFGRDMLLSMLMHYKTLEAEIKQNIYGQDLSGMRSPPWKG